MPEDPKPSKPRTPRPLFDTVFGVGGNGHPPAADRDAPVPTTPHLPKAPVPPRQQPSVAAPPVTAPTELVAQPTPVEAAPDVVDLRNVLGGTEESVGLADLVRRLKVREQLRPPWLRPSWIAFAVLVVGALLILLVAMASDGAEEPTVASFPPTGSPTTSAPASPATAADVPAPATVPGTTLPTPVTTTVAPTTTAAPTTTVVTTIPPPTTVPATTTAPPATTAPPVTSIPPATSIEPVGEGLTVTELALWTSGLGPLRIGAAAPGVLGTLVASLGPPDADTGTTVSAGQWGTCASDVIRIVQWGALVVIVGIHPDNTDTFQAYAVDARLNGAAGLAADLQTVSGLKTGDTVARLEQLYGNRFALGFTTDLVEGPIYEIRGVNGVLLWGPVTSPGPQGVVQGIFSPGACEG